MTARLVAAIDVGATKTLVAVRPIDGLGQGWADGEVARAPTERDPDALVGWIGESADRLAMNTGGSIAAIGVAAPGPLDAYQGVVTRSSNLGWDHVPLGPMLSGRLGAPAFLEDDANTAAVGEWRFGAGRGSDPMAYLTISSGVGGAIIVSGEVVRGASGNAGEIGHLRVTADGPRCACGRRGDVESYAGGAALARRARRTWPSATAAGSPPRRPEDVFRAARQHDPAAAVIVEEAATALSVALAAFTASLDPEAIIVGGSIGLGQPRLVRRATRLARGRVLAESGRSLRVLPAALGSESVLAGAAALASRRLDPLPPER